MKKEDINVIVMCEESQTVCLAFRKMGFNAFSNDIIDCSGGHPEYHLKGSYTDYMTYKDWHLAICHPPCTYLSSAGLHYNNRHPERADKTLDALNVVMHMLNMDIPYIALENPSGRISTAIRKPDQYIQPYNFGDDASKRTGLWLKNLPLLTPTTYVSPRVVIKNGKRYFRWSNQDDNGRNTPMRDNGKYYSYSDPEVKKIRSKTFKGIAEAMAAQWGSFIHEQLNK